jgi:hypothetical protein
MVWLKDVTAGVGLMLFLVSSYVLMGAAQGLMS